MVIRKARTDTTGPATLENASCRNDMSDYVNTRRRLLELTTGNMMVFMSETVKR
jgi:hypothetical protein